MKNTGYKKIILAFLSLITVILSFSFIKEVSASTYSSSGTITSTNILSGLGVSSIDKFGYNTSSIPANTSIKVSFSQDNSTWKNSSGTIDGWDTLSQGDYLAEGSAINLATLGWSGNNFYYKTQFDTTDTSATAVLDEVVVYYSQGASVSTQVVSNTTPAGTTGNGTLIAISGGNATTRGFKYGLSQTDTWDIHADGDFGAGTYSLDLTGLSPNTTYYIRAYATNPGGTGYGSWVSFTTSAYYSSGTLTSTNILLGQTVTLINNLSYTLSSKPAGTIAYIQFSQNGTNWYNSTGVLNGIDTLIQGSYIIQLHRLNWTSANFYYKVTLGASSSLDSTPVLDYMSLGYNDPLPKDVQINGNMTINGNTTIGN